MVTSSILVLFLLGLTAATVLAAASKVLHVSEDPRIAQVEGCFPGANCGGCGYPGCSAAAGAIVKGHAGPEICVAGGAEIAENIASIMGLEASFKEPKVANNICTGGSRANLLFDYEGVEDCRAEALLYGGEKTCGLGCIGMGSCVKVCGFDAIRLNEDDIPVVDMNACRSCGKCAEVCPTGAIRISGMTMDLLHLNKIDDCLAPCMQKCPAQIDVRTYINQMKHGDMRGALLTIKERNPLPLAVGRLCPAPCETICRRNIADDGVAIHTLHRFVADWEMNSGSRLKLDCNPATGHKVAIIGGGPAGLSCAYFLRRIGHEPVIFEKREQVGGMMKGIIPEYRLPAKVVDWEVQSILDLGVSVCTGVEFGKDITLKSLEEEGYEAIFIATGAWKVPALEVENADADGVVDAVTFLEQVGKSITDLKGQKIVVVGDTNTAMDVVRSAARLGCDVSSLVGCIQRKMSANKNEVKRAAELGSELMFLTRPTRIIVEGGKVSGIEYCEVQYDDPGKAMGVPRPVEGTEKIMSADLVVVATDRVIDTECLKDEAGAPLFAVNKKTGGIKADKTSMQTDRPNVFAGGEASTGRSILIQAVADGRRAARGIHHFISEGAIPEPDNPQLRVIPESILKNMEVTYTIPRIKVPEISVEERRSTFKEEVKGSIVYEAARKEGSRCLRCGLTCYDSEAGAEYAADADVQKFCELGKE
ncbi:FAD-dependent oxidoreductase [Maridesulfovibrio hydrothermalis]|uniref:Ion-translocating oxidoreductase complex subunit B n=1 Tax=Maridesulfovibrio hydrothermalis AM13 = DSM 14728 TaxID=1121451 RepID=L0RH10_9BACT|nr:FAD-dependent oxidoreductase [Maridesulfovibrio hydrothermalis]CCO25490.1 Electron transport complex, RnfABCDGE type, B subunit [Maridesulfovibrio hydrothermalis AM13 = DSM 14728]